MSRFVLGGGAALLLAVALVNAAEQPPGAKSDVPPDQDQTMPRQVGGPFDNQFLPPETQKQLKLTEEQKKKKVEDLERDRRAKRRGLPTFPPANVSPFRLQNELEDKGRQLLTEEQKKILDRLQKQDFDNLPLEVRQLLTGQLPPAKG